METGLFTAFKDGNSRMKTLGGAVKLLEERESTLKFLLDKKMKYPLLNLTLTLGEPDPHTLLEL